MVCFNYKPKPMLKGDEEVKSSIFITSDEKYVPFTQKKGEGTF